MAERKNDYNPNRQPHSLNVLLLGSLITMVFGTGIFLLQPAQQSPALQPTSWAALLAASLILAGSWLLARQGKVHIARLVFTSALTIETFALVILKGGSLPTLLFLLIIPVATASLLLGTSVGFGISALALVTAFIPDLLQINSQAETYVHNLNLFVQLLPVALGLGFLSLCNWLSRHDLDQELAQSRGAVEEIEKHRQELEDLLLVEQENRERFQQAITDTSNFLNRILSGEKTARLDLQNMDPALTGLGRLLNRTADSLSEAIDQYQHAAGELNAAQRRYILQSWQHYLKAHRQHEFETMRPGANPPYSELKTLLAQAAKPGDGGVEKNGNGKTSLTLVEPIQIGGEVIGTLGLCRETGERPWSPEEHALIAAITERLALAAENLRLHEDAQRRAAQERLIAQVSARARETLDVDTVLKTTLRELGSSLDVAEVEVRLGPPPTSNANRPVGLPDGEEA